MVSNTRTLQPWANVRHLRWTSTHLASVTLQFHIFHRICVKQQQTCYTYYTCSHLQSIRQKQRFQAPRLSTKPSNLRRSRHQLSSQALKREASRAVSWPMWSSLAWRDPMLMAECTDGGQAIPIFAGMKWRCISLIYFDIASFCFYFQLQNKHGKYGNSAVLTIWLPLSWQQQSLWD